MQEAIELFKEHQKGTVKKSTLKSYGKFLDRFLKRFSACEVVSISADQIGRFLEECTEGLIRSTRHLRYAQIKAFFNADLLRIIKKIRQYRSGSAAALRR
ncbi:MAG TPA: site-specific integrase, partial [Anaerolineales bacterium]|nr:site-specific integrase [Anaerolineales bacterium]